MMLHVRRLAGVLRASSPQSPARTLSTSPLASSAAEGDGEPAKYENVRKLVVGLGNPGEKFAKTRCAPTRDNMYRRFF